MDITTDPDKAGGVPQEETQFKSTCKIERSNIENQKKRILALKQNPQFGRPEEHPGQHGEMAANLQLCFRHLEDARMRLGKAIQAFDGGKSIYED